MGLPWVRMDSSFPSHDKILALIADPSPKRWQAAFSWSAAIAWSGGAGTDGYVPAYALTQVHGNQTTARLLVKYDLWEERTAGWVIRNFDQRQALTAAAEAKRASAQAASKKANCVRHHGKDCGCWERDS